MGMARIKLKDMILTGDVVYHNRDSQPYKVIRTCDIHRECTRCIRYMPRSKTWAQTITHIHTPWLYKTGSSNIALQRWDNLEL